MILEIGIEKDIEMPIYKEINLLLKNGGIHGIR